MRYPTSPLDEQYFGPSPTATYKIPIWVNITELTEEERIVYDAEEKKKEEQRIIWRKEMERKQAEEDAKKKELEGAEQTGDSEDDESEGVGGDTTENDNESATAAASGVEGMLENENKTNNEDMTMGEDGAVANTDSNVNDDDTSPAESVIATEGENKSGADSSMTAQLEENNDLSNEVNVDVAEPTSIEEIQPMSSEKGVAAIDDSKDEVSAVEQVSQEAEYSAPTIEAHAPTAANTTEGVDSSAPVLSITEGSSMAAEGLFEEKTEPQMMDVENDQLQVVTGEELNTQKEEDLVSES